MSAPVIAELVGRQVLIDVEQRRVRVCRQVDIEQGDDRLEALGVDDGPLLQRKGRSVEDERKMRRTPERRPILELDGNRLALLGDVQEVRVAGQVYVIGKQKLEGRLADEILVLRVELFVDDGDAAAVSYDLQARRVGEFKSHAPRTSQAELSFGAASVGPDLYEIGAQTPGRVEPGVGALNGFVRWNRRWSALRRFGRLFRRRGRRGQIKRRLLRE